MKEVLMKQDLVMIGEDKNDSKILNLSDQKNDNTKKWKLRIKNYIACRYFSSKQT